MNMNLSRAFLATSVSLFAIGILSGLVQYLNRSAEIEKYQPGSSAIGIHIGLGIGAAIALGVVYGYQHRRPKAPLVLLAPFSQTAFTRFTSTALLRGGFSIVKVIRAGLSVFLAFMLLYNVWRAGDQVIGGLDPNYVINAWGGPSYLGASLAHWLDTALLFYLIACLLNLVMLKRKK